MGGGALSVLLFVLASCAAAGEARSARAVAAPTTLMVNAAFIVPPLCCLSSRQAYADGRAVSAPGCTRRLCEIHLPGGGYPTGGERLASLRDRRPAVYSGPMFKGRAMTIPKSLAFLTKLMEASAASRRRLPAGRCACHEST